MLRSVGFVTVLLLLGCTTAGVHGQPDETSPDFLVPPGSRLVLHQPLQVPAWQDQVYFQDGKTMSWREVNAYMPYCTLTLAAKKETAQTIRPDTFVVHKSFTELFYKQVSAPVPQEGARIAAAGWIQNPQAAFEGVSLEGRDSMDYKAVAAVMELVAKDQPDVNRMLCTDWGLPPEQVHITVKKIRRALGDTMTLQLAPPAPQSPQLPQSPPAQPSSSYKVSMIPR